MTSISATGWCVLMLLAVGGASALFAWLLRLSHAPGGRMSAAMLGGCVAGLLLGPGVLGTVAPEVYQRLFVGDVDERRALESKQREEEIDRAALKASGATGIAQTEASAARRDELDRILTARMDAAKRRKDFSLACAGLLQGLTLFLGACWSPRRDRTRRLEPAWPAVGAGLAAFLFAALPAAALFWWLVGAWALGAAAFGASAGIGSVFLSARTRAPGCSLRSLRVAGGVGMICVSILVGVCAPQWIWFELCGLGIIGGSIALYTRAGPRWRGVSRSALVGIVVPALFALFVSTMDPHKAMAGGHFWIPAIISVVFSNDGRMFGGWLGWRALGCSRIRAAAWQRSAAMMDSMLGPVQFCVGVWLTGFDDGLMAALIVGALSVEMTAELRRWIARRLDGSSRPLRKA